MLLPALILAWALAGQAQDEALTCKPQEGLPLSPPYRPPYFQPSSLPVCSQYTCSCCNRAHALAIYRALRVVAEDPRFSRACLAWQTRLACRICDPEVGVGLKPAICRSACDEWLAACRDDYFTFEGAVASTSFLGGRLLPCASSEALAAGAGAGGGEGSGPLLCSRLGDVARDGEELCREAGFTVADPTAAASSGAGAGLGGAAGAVAAVLAAAGSQGEADGDEDEGEGASCFDGSPTATFRTDFCQPPPPPARAQQSDGRRRKGAGDEEDKVSSPVYFLAVAVIASVLWLTYTTRQGFQATEDERIRQLHWQQMQGRTE